jgi:hypothetical protein
MNTICFGQQPCGFFPKRYLIAKINSARALQKKIGGHIIFFYHDSDADYRETITIFTDRQTGAEVRLNFTQENKLQKKFSPLYLKRVPVDWKEEILKQMPRFMSEHPPLTPPLKGGGSAVIPSPLWGGLEPALSDSRMGRGAIEIFKSVNATNVADFCLEMYKKMSLLDGIEIFRSSDKTFREKALNLDKDYFADVEYQGEMVRAQLIDEKLQLHEGGGKYITLPHQTILKSQISPNRDQRFAWMQSVIHCTHYIAGNSEYDYLKKENSPEVEFVKREQIENPEMAWI